LHRPIDLPRSAGGYINSLNCSARSPFETVGRNILEIAYCLLSEQNTYRELGIDYFDRYRAERLERTPPRRSRKIFRTATPL
jgi:hypothetical protein